MESGPLASQGAPHSAPLHLKHVEGMRAAAALVVFVNHAYAQVWAGFSPVVPPPTGLLSIFSLSMVAGHLSVAVFIVISGFCLALPLVRNDGEMGSKLAFFKRRARRILPPYYGALALALLLIATVISEPTGSLWDVALRVSRVSILSHVLLLQNLFGTGSINYVFWSIAVEFQIYLLFPVLVFALKRFDFRWVAAGALVLAYALSYTFQETRINRTAIHFIGLFALGAIAAHLALSPREQYARLRDRVPWASVAAVGFAIPTALTVHWGIEVSRERFPILDLFVGFGTMAALVVSTRSSTSRLRSALAWAPLSFVGLFSYSLYLIHAPLLQIMWQYGLRDRGLTAPLMFGLLMTVGLGLTLTVAYGFFRVFEEPFMRSAQRASPRLSDLRGQPSS